MPCCFDALSGSSALLAVVRRVRVLPVRVHASPLCACDGQNSDTAPAALSIRPAPSPHDRPTLRSAPD